MLMQSSINGEMWETARVFKRELNPKIYFSLFEHSDIVEPLYEVFLSC